MGEHEAPGKPSWRVALDWALAHKRSILGVAVVALPLLSRYVPGFPAEEVLSLLRSFLGA